MRHDLLGTEVSFRPPSTTRDLLHYRVWIAAVRDPEQRWFELIRWVASWVETPAEFAGPDGLAAFLGAADPSAAAAAFVELAEAIALSAELPPDLIERLQVMLDRQNGIDPKWKPKPSCDCARCRRDLDHIPEGATCLYEEAGADVLHVADWVGDVLEGSSSEPYYLTQIRGAYSRASGRWSAHERERREREEEQREEKSKVLDQVFGPRK